MNTLSPDEMKRFQELSNEFAPDVQVSLPLPAGPCVQSSPADNRIRKGPLVSAKQSSSTIALDYANADPTYATKTSALAVTHPFSRIMKGDGNCGWRAVAFGYFECLFNLRDTLQVHRELLRIKSLSSLLDQVGQQEHLYEIFVEATEQVFTQVSEAIQNGARDESFLVDAFNIEYNSSAIITHFRLLTSAWMKLNPHRYQAFLSLPLDQYCATRVETVKTEIDEVGLQALVDGVIEGSGFAVEILYLDRSAGDAVTPHLLTPSRSTSATIRLLYRPGHYDILYRVEPTVNMEPVVAYQYGMTTNFSPWEQGALSFDVNSSLMSIPGLMMDPSFAMAPAAPAPMSPAPSSPYRVSSPHEMFPPAMPSPPSAIPVSTPSPPRMSGPPPPMNSLPSRSSDGPQIRLNPLVMKQNLNHSLPVTTPFKNSPYNQAHFQNQDFEPIHWEPNESRK
ncbi:OTU family ubiquitin thioesterase [Aspergillus clavatus NRRL 1]|uniref:ubiquitinyl hydrolase 1 n=1 Tax=Aspergillus clavatus (strain ATCC 1007 / CBS 513.65 / DSM 816 / NCTC 3887 / NRRL 1 / QM 1276 / 107) TaxID=344612 RepID=A1CJE1_ASPCL|nr:ubiquitin thiolesterase (OtuB1), putative [Aspergillus clavatus NRRL 1]EAW09265.1 ubiquitin thiolesterase (OtuB1), putative [Aspergillus clavatus NRRL 1]